MRTLKTKKIISVCCLFLTAFIWGIAFVFQAQGAEKLESFTFNGTRFLIGTVSLIPVVLFFERKNIFEKRVNYKRMIPACIICGSVLFCASSLQQIGIKETASAGLAGFITAIYTVLTPILYLLIFRRKTRIEIWIGAVMAVVGLSLLCFKADEGLVFGKGELLLLIGAFFWAFHMISVDRYAKDHPSLLFSWGQFAVCTALSIISMFVFEAAAFSFDAVLSAKWDLLYCGVMSVGIAYTLQVVGQKHADPTFAAIVFSLESVFSMVGGVIAGTDILTLMSAFGCVVIFASIIISQLNIFHKGPQS